MTRAQVDERALLCEMYALTGQTLTDAATALGITTTTLSAWLGTHRMCRTRARLTRRRHGAACHHHERCTR